MISTANKHIQPKSYFTSNLAKLLQQRGLTQKEFAKLTGISQRAISRIKNRRRVNRIDCGSAIRMCLVLSAKPRTRNRKSQSIRLDALFPLVSSAKTRMTKMA